jgi:hypothetical protein
MTLTRKILTGFKMPQIHLKHTFEHQVHVVWLINMLAIEANGMHHVSMHFGQQVSLCYVDHAW